jgi:hypothetical protein
MQPTQRWLAGPAQIAHLSVATSSVLTGVGCEAIAFVAWLAICEDGGGVSLQ